MSTPPRSYEEYLEQQAAEDREWRLKEIEKERGKDWYAPRDKENQEAWAASDGYMLELDQRDQFVSRARFEARSQNPPVWLTVDSHGFPISLGLGQRVRYECSQAVVYNSGKASIEYDWRVRAVIAMKEEHTWSDGEPSEEERKQLSDPLPRLTLTNAYGIAGPDPYEPSDDRDALDADREQFERWIVLAGDPSHRDHAFAVSKLDAYLDGTAEVYWATYDPKIGVCRVWVDGTGLVTRVEVSGYKPLENLRLAWIMRWAGFRAREWRTAKLAPMRAKLANLAADREIDLTLLDAPEPPEWPEHEEREIRTARDNWLAALEFNIRPELVRGWGF